MCQLVEVGRDCEAVPGPGRGPQEDTHTWGLRLPLPLAPDDPCVALTSVSGVCLCAWTLARVRLCMCARGGESGAACPCTHVCTSVCVHCRVCLHGKD